MVFWINFFHLFDNFMHTHFHCIFSSFLTWGSHSHFITIRYMIGRPIGRSIVCSSPPSHFLPSNKSPMYLCFPFIGGWYTYNKSCIKCGYYFFMIITWVFNMKVFGSTKEVCNLFSIGVGPLHITSSWFFYSWLRFLYSRHTNGI
jgi:hypothetical protein